MSLPDITPKYQDVEVKGVGTFRMRALSFDEAQDVLETIDAEGRETVLRALTTALEEPADEVEEWVKTGHSKQVEQVFTRLMQISGANAEEAEALGN